METVIKAIIKIVIFTAIYCVILTFIIGTPTVYESYSTGECVWVDSPSDEFSCDNLPLKYTRTWVK